eukprot:g5405.t1
MGAKQGKSRAFRSEGHRLGSAASEEAAAAQRKMHAENQARLHQPSRTQRTKSDARKAQARAAAAQKRQDAWGNRLATNRAKREMEKREAGKRAVGGHDGKSGTARESARHYTTAAPLQPTVDLGFDPTKADFTSANAARKAQQTIQHGKLMENMEQHDPSMDLARAMSICQDLSPHNLDFQDALAMLMSNPDEQAALQASRTVLKLLRNAVQNPSEQKFRTVKLSNPKIQSKVIFVHGAAALLVCAGFRFSDGMDGDPVLTAEGADVTQMGRIASLIDDQLSSLS